MAIQSARYLPVTPWFSRESRSTLRTAIATWHHRSPTEMHCRSTRCRSSRCHVHCRIEPYLIKAARCARRGPASASAFDWPTRTDPTIQHAVDQPDSSARSRARALPARLSSLRSPRLACLGRPLGVAPRWLRQPRHPIARIQHLYGGRDRAHTWVNLGTLREGLLMPRPRKLDCVFIHQPEGCVASDPKRLQSAVQDLTVELLFHLDMIAAHLGKAYLPGCIGTYGPLE